ncbi:MAG TPA: CBS domain-containing protein [Allosphingosinicella sp.]|jgi:CBS domain-containing protein
MKISDVMTRDVATVDANQTAREAANFMLEGDAGSIPVTDGETLIGMITDRDIAVRGVALGLGPDTPVRELMTDGLICARVDDSIQDVADKMSEAQVRRLPVIDEDENLVGIVSLGDLSRETEGEEAHEALEGVSQPGAQHAQ